MEYHYEDTFVANIYCGLKESYNGHVHKVAEAQLLLEEYCNEKTYAVTMTETTFVYCNGQEPGIIVGLINYPRYPSTPDKIKERAVEIGIMLKEKFKQERVSIVASDGTIMLGKK